MIRMIVLPNIPVVCRLCHVPERFLSKLTLDDLPMCSHICSSVEAHVSGGQLDLLQRVYIKSKERRTCRLSWVPHLISGLVFPYLYPKKV